MAGYLAGVPRDDPLPLPPGPVSNGEVLPPPPSGHDHWLHREMRARSDEAARRAGIDRRVFLQGAGAVAVALATYNAAAC